MDLLGTVPTSTPDPRMPLALRGARVFLILSIVGWTFGAIQGTHHLLDALGKEESDVQIAIDLRLLVERTLLLVVAGLAYVAIGRRRVAGKWMTLCLALIVGYRLSHAAAHAFRAVVFADFSAAPPLIPYSSREEGAIALIMNAAIFGWLMFMTVQLAVGSAVRKYFDTRQADARAGDEARSGTSYRC